MRTSNGTAYELTGPKNAETIVLIHGLGLNRRIWREYGAQLYTRYRVLSYDLFGHGESVNPPEKPSLQVFSNQLFDLLNVLDIDKSGLIGFSLGGMINRRFVIDHANRVSALVILNSPHERTPDAQKMLEQRVIDSSAGGPGATLEATLKRWFTSEFRESRPAYIQQVRQWVLANNAAIYASCRQVLATGVMELIKPQPAISCPALVITCENDSGSTPAMSHAIAAEIKSSQTVIVPHLKHMGLVEKPDLFIEPMMDFLKVKLK